VPFTGSRRTLLSVDVATGQIRGNWSFHISLPTLELALSAEAVLIGGGGLMCGQKQGQKCLISLLPSSGDIHDVILDPGGDHVQLGVLWAASASQPMVAWETFTGSATNTRILLLDWRAPPGSQVVFNSSYIPIVCAPGADCPSVTLSRRC